MLPYALTSAPTTHTNHITHLCVLWLYGSTIVYVELPVTASSPYVGVACRLSTFFGLFSLSRGGDFMGDLNGKLGTFGISLDVIKCVTLLLKKSSTRYTHFCQLPPATLHIHPQHQA